MRSVLHSRSTSIRIGTPLSGCAARVMLPGSGELGKEVIISLQRLGVEVVAVDRYANAPAQQVAHWAHAIEMMDGAALAAAIAQGQARRVAPEIQAIAPGALLALAHAKQVTVLPTTRAASLTMRREGIPGLAAEELGLPTSPARFAGSLAEMRAACDETGYPCGSKPVRSSPGTGQSNIDNPEADATAWKCAASRPRANAGCVVIAGFIDFDYEGTHLPMRALGTDGKSGIRSCEPIGPCQVQGDYVEPWQPHPMHAQARAAAPEIAKTVADNLGGLGVVGVESFVNGVMVWFSEVSPRPRDTGTVTTVTHTQSKVALHAKASSGLAIAASLRTPGASAMIYGRRQGHGNAFEGVNDGLRMPGTDIRRCGQPEAFALRRMDVALRRQEQSSARAKRRQVRLHA